MPNHDFHKMRRLPPYVFAEVNALKDAARAAGQDIIDLGMGNPDMPTPPHIVEKLIEAIHKPRSNRYSASKGITGLRKAQANYYQRRFGVELNPDKEVVVTLGSKEGLANLAQAITAPGDVIIVPNPSYPIHPFGFLIAGATLRHVPSPSPEEFLRGLDKAVRHSVPSPSMVVVSYPSNPSAQVVDIAFYEEIVRFAKKHDLWVLSDLAYSEIYFDDYVPPSILQVPGAKDIAVEFTSVSKTFAMPGWRIGFAVGAPVLIAALTRIKSYLDYGAYTPIQVAAAAALNGSDECIVQMRAIYKSRRDVLVESFGRAGWTIPVPRAGMFCWAPIPDKFKHLGSVEFSKKLLTEAGVAVAPGLGFGEYGDDFIRIGLVENEHRIRQAARNIKRMMNGNSGE